MRFATAVVLALALLPTSPALAQSTPAPCDARAANLGGIGRASVVAFTGPVLGARVCATVANLASDTFTVRIADAAPADALVAAALTGEPGTAALPFDGATAVGRYVIAPPGTIPSFNGEIAEAPRVVVAFAGARVLVIGTTPVALVDLARELRDQPDLFGADAIERAVLIASGPGAALSLHTADGVVGASSVSTAKVLVFIKRG